jgi:hypothetical protein
VKTVEGWKFWFKLVSYLIPIMHLVGVLDKIAALQSRQEPDLLLRVNFELLKFRLMKRL